MGCRNYPRSYKSRVVLTVGSSLSQAEPSPFTRLTQPLVWDPTPRSSPGEPDHRKPQRGLLETHFS